MKICVIGAGYVGLITALVLAKVDHHVICVDKDHKKISKLNNNISPIYEEGLDDLLTFCMMNKEIIFTTDIIKGISEADIIYIAVGTPSLEDGNVDMSQVTSAINTIASHIDRYKIIINKSTVPIGTQKMMTTELINRGISKDLFDVVSNPEFLREGKAISDFLNSDRIVIGYDSERAKAVLEKVYKNFNSPIIFTTPETSELIKYASNAFLSTKISFINELANLCDKINADIGVTAYALGLDHRISPEFFKAGIGFGGSCFPKDTNALVRIGEKYNSPLKIVQSAIEVNNKQKLKPLDILTELFTEIKNKEITILGLTFKPDTDDIRDAPSIDIINKLIEMGAYVKAYDPVGIENAKKVCPDAHYYNNLYESIKDSHCIILCTEWKEFYNMDLKLLANIMKAPVMIDGRNYLCDRNPKDYGIYYYTIGRDVL